MSYVIHVLSVDPLPQTVDEAFAALTQANLEAQNARGTPAGDAPSAVLLALAQQLWAQYPLDADGGLDEHGPWLEGLPTPDPGSRVWTLGLNTSSRKVTQGYEYLLQHSAALGLVVLDEQQGVAVLPSGVPLGGMMVLPQAPRKSSDPQDWVPGGRVNYREAGTSESELYEELNEGLRELMQEHQFTRDMSVYLGHFERTNGDLLQLISIRILDFDRRILYYGYGVNLSAGVKFTDVMKEIQRICRPSDFLKIDAKMFPGDDMVIFIGNYLEYVNPNYFSYENPEYVHISACSAESLQGRWRNLPDSDPKTPSMISYWKQLPFTNRHELQHETLGRLKHFLTHEVFRTLDGLRTVADIADYALTSSFRNPFYRNDRMYLDTWGMWTIAVGMARPERLKEFCERFNNVVETDYFGEVKSGSFYARDPEEALAYIERCRIDCKTYISNILEYFEKRPT